MTDLTPDQLTATTTIADGDLLIIYLVGSTVMRKVRWDVFQDLVVDALGDAVLAASANLSDLPNPSVARGNLGLGSVAVLAASAVFQVANNLSEVANAATARANIGAAAAASPTITGGMTYSGQTKQNAQAVAALDIDVSLAEAFSKAISSNSTFTFSGVTASKVQGFLLFLTTSSLAQPAWPASVKWEGGALPEFPNGEHVVSFVTPDGGTTWYGALFGQSFAVPA